MKKGQVIVFLLAAVLFMMSCRKEKSTESNITYTPTPHTIPIPPGFPYMIIPPDNPTTLEGIQLGRMLFYDPIIDKNQQRACSNCHVLKHSFSSDTNSLPHINLAWNNAFLWNGKIQGVLENIMQFEVEQFFQTDLTILNNNKTYHDLFIKAFGTETITSKEVAYALAQFIRTLISNKSKWDLYLNGYATLSPQEENGRKLFFTEKGDCFHCHGTILLTDNYFHNNGLDSFPAPGRATITQDPKDVGKFKTPTLRNIEFTAPYMHDGRFKTLEEVINFYCVSVKWSPTIDPMMKKVSQGGVHLTAEQQSDLLAFLKTFTDTAFVNNPGFSDPFRK